MTRKQGLTNGSMARVLVAVGLLASAGLVHAADYCCRCKSQTGGTTLDAPNRAVAIGQCSVECGGFANVVPGKCAAPPPAATPAPATPPPAATPAPAAPPTPRAPGGVVLAYQSADCSGDPIRVAGSTARLAQTGVLSFRVESGASASAWEKTDYAGRGTAPVAPSICVSPGFEIQSIRLQ